MAKGDQGDEAASAQPVFTCDECGAELVLAKNRKSTACPYCKCPSVHELPDQDARPEPALVLPFVAAESAARAAVHTWTRRLRVFRESLSDATIDQIEGIYLPAYLYSASTVSTYSARIGENYTETETYTETENGKTVTKTRTVTRTEYRSLSGDFVGYVADVLVTGSKGLPNQELEHIEPFDMRLLRRYDAALISGWTAEHPTLRRETCQKLARSEATEEIGNRLGEHMPGDSYTDLTYQTHVDRETLDLTLVPVWVLVLRPDSEAATTACARQRADAGGVGAGAPVLAEDRDLSHHRGARRGRGGFAERGRPMSERSCERCSTPLEDGDLRCCICGMCAPAAERAPVAVEALRIVRCKECGAAVSYRVEKRAPVCRFCGAETRVEEPTDPVERPSEYLEFGVEREEAVSAMRTYLASLGWFRPADLAHGATVDSLTPLYFAAWAFDAEADVTWAADSDAGSRRSDWAPHAGRTHLSWRNVLVSASRGLRQKEVHLLARGYDLAKAQHISDDIAGEVEQFDVQRSAARATVLSAVNALAAADIEREHVPGSRARNVHVSALLERLVTRRVALPCFVFVYRYDGRPYRCIVHGRDSRIACGSAPLSWTRIAFVVVLVLLAILVAVAIAGR